MICYVGISTQFFFCENQTWWSAQLDHDTIPSDAPMYEATPHLQATLLICSMRQLRKYCVSSWALLPGSSKPTTEFAPADRAASIPQPFAAAKMFIARTMSALLFGLKLQHAFHHNHSLFFCRVCIYAGFHDLPMNLCACENKQNN